MPTPHSLFALIAGSSLITIAMAQTFSQSKTFTFTGSALPPELTPSTWPVYEDSNPNAKYDRIFEEKNVVVRDGFLELRVPGGQKPTDGGRGPISCAEVGTTFEVKYASVKTYAILSEEPGVCNGMFMYKDYNQETDIEWISDPESFANQQFSSNGSRVLLYTNQGPSGNTDALTVSGRAPADATSAVHEYRLDWTEDAVEFYLDGVKQQTLTDYVPTVGGSWLWNSWVNGDPYFTAGPPVNDAVFKILRIEMDYNPA
ncbi:hypothetical protein CKM354_000586500 [Cercospora kikuchii]|uniref:GH16 domain-containing protein n=1 Tax=Cercospora kikuchii TaxID=84275 RepID=A0A9P3CLD5_9PEZI|nr:uncharacterized protein CKM354_000586500 [Cercospora kikuchii]GIZ42605.1 hypothetical protein CKM354_000586500 [Cercospora kikuchii]